MADWSITTKHEPSSINNGKRYEQKDRVALEQLNNMTENTFYAVAKSEEALKHAQSGGTRVLVDGVFQSEFNADGVQKVELIYDYIEKPLTQPLGIRATYELNADFSKFNKIFVDMIFANVINGTLVIDLNHKNKNNLYRNVFISGSEGFADLASDIYYADINVNEAKNKLTNSIMGYFNTTSGNFTPKPNVDIYHIRRIEGVY